MSVLPKSSMSSLNDVLLKFDIRPVTEARCSDNKRSHDVVYIKRFLRIDIDPDHCKGNCTMYQGSAACEQLRRQIRYTAAANDLVVKLKKYSNGV